MTARLLGLRVRILPGHGCLPRVICVLSGRGLCAGLITRPEESHEWGVSECDREVSIMRGPLPTGGCYGIQKKG